MRTIKFRGFSQKENKWIYGYGAFGPGFIGEGYIINYEIYSKGMQVVNLNTIGQYTGLKDKNKKEIYEGDIVKFTNKKGVEIISEVVFYDGVFELTNYDYKNCTDKSCVNCYELLKWVACDCEVVGNIFENGEILK